MNTGPRAVCFALVMDYNRSAFTSFREFEYMSSVEVKLSLPDSLVSEAEASGLLSAEAIENLLRDEIQRRRIDRLFEAGDRLAAQESRPMTEAEVEAEIKAARKARQQSNASSG